MKNSPCAELGKPNSAPVGYGKNALLLNSTEHLEKNNTGRLGSGQKE